MDRAKNKKIIASIEARMSSTRLPGKMLADIGGKPVLTRIIDRLRQAGTLNGIVVATTDQAADDPLASLAEREQVPCFRGSETDVLGRVVGAHQMMGADIVVEITGDCPLVDPKIIDLGVNAYLNNDVDVVVNASSFPIGIDVQVFSLAALVDVKENISDAAVREHVSLYFYEHPARYRILRLPAPEHYHAPQFRLVLDYPEDLQLIREIYRRLTPRYGPIFGTPEIIELLAAEPALVKLNSHCVEKSPR